MADTDPPKKPKRTVKKLPPLTGETEEGSEVKKVVKKKKKKPTEETANGTTPKSPEGTPRKKKKPAAKPETGKEENGETASAKPTPRKKKKKPVAKKEGEEGEPTSARSQGEDVAGSKTSLISKEQTGTPKKKVKKKVKKTTPRKQEDEFLDSTLAADLTTIQEDIVSPREKAADTAKQGDEEEEEEEEAERHPYSTESNILKSQPLDKLFIETDSGFKGQNKAKLVRKWAEAEANKADTTPQVKRTTIELALSTHNALKTFLLFVHGITAGISVWHITMSYILLFFNYIDFLEHYRILALPVQCMFYILLVLCTVSACDRFDVGNPNRRFMLESLTLQTGTISVLIYFAALVISLCTANLEDKMNLYTTNTTLSGLWDNPGESTSDLDLWTSLNTARCVLAIIGWFIIAINPNTDRLYDNLRKSDDNILGGNSMQLASSRA
ncbi:transmembrane protein 237-like [Mizuhopecten yessoensis]|uniref:Transmembrane protein 237 n=1 Tax=Mizuhopecten yessoensis TaxID=6573 RepID=A0A210QSA1_MIZYE|nr:transmembrane protein 237-like [Mizuhopecten yessoensis]OWF51606.1 Transmembrane protein 237 [Mizuhopecten yessoensis]